MSRSRASAKQAGAKFERLVADYLAEHVDDRIDRRVKTGAKDKGDIANVRYGRAPFIGWAGSEDGMWGRVVVECKDTARPSLGVWAAEAEAERINDGADVAVIASKRHGKSAAGDQWVHMTLRELATLLSGRRPGR